MGEDYPYLLQADFSGLNGAKDLRLSSFIQFNTFANEQQGGRKKRQTPAVWEAKVERVRDARVERVREARVDRVMDFLRRRKRQEITYQLHFERQFM